MRRPCAVPAATASPSSRRLLATPLVWGLCATIDGLSGGADTALFAGGMGLLVGLSVALLWVGIGAALARLPGAVAGLPWLGGGAAVGWFLIDELGVLSRLDGPHGTLAWMALVGAVGCGLLLGLTLMAAQPTRARGDGWLGERRRWAWLLPLVALGALYVDRTRFVGLYPAAHDALRLTTLVLLAVMASLIRRPPLRRSLTAALVVLGAALAALPFFALHRGADKGLQRLIDRPLAALQLDALRRLTDVDGDGASSLLGGGDQTPFDAAPPPRGVVEVVEEPAHAQGPSPMSVVLITIDTLRPDRMSMHGHSRPTTPKIDAFAARGLRFERAITPGGWTSLAISSLMRGVAPRRLTWTQVVETSDYELTRWRDRAQLDPKLRLRMMFGLPLDDRRPPLAERLARRSAGDGMHTMAVVDDGYGQFLSPKMEADRGFADFRAVDDLPKVRRNDRGTTALALAALEARPKDRRFFMWVHYFGPHDPTRRQPGVPWYGDGIADGYDHEVQAVDRAVGPLLDRLAALAEAEPLAVVLTSDHGEQFFEKRRMHGLSVEPLAVRIPLIVVGPGIAPGVSDAPASLLDVHPTVLALTETPAPGGLDGLDLRRVAAERPRRVLTVDTWRYNRHRKVIYDQVGVTDGRHLLRLDRKRNVRALWSMDDRETPPVDLSGMVPAAHLEAGLTRYLDATGGGRVRWVE